MAQHPLVRQRGFTLIELLVALAVMALLAIVSWRGLDGMVRAQQQTRQRGDELLVLQAALAQWGADLDAVLPLAHTVPLDWDGQVLRITRRSSAVPDPGALVVAWARRNVQSGNQKSKPMAALAVAAAAHARPVATSVATSRAVGTQPQRRRSTRRSGTDAADRLADFLLPGRRLEQPTVEQRQLG